MTIYVYVNVYFWDCILYIVWCMVCSTRADDELVELAETGNMRTDIWKIGDEDTSPDADKDSIAMNVTFMLPMNLRWLGGFLVGTMYDQKKLLKKNTDQLREVIIDNVGFCTFQEAFDRTGRIINIIVAPKNKYDPPRLLNYLTAPHVW